MDNFKDCFIEALEQRKRVKAMNIKQVLETVETALDKAHKEYASLSTSCSPEEYETKAKRLTKLMKQAKVLRQAKEVIDEIELEHRDSFSY